MFSGRLRILGCAHMLAERTCTGLCTQRREDKSRFIDVTFQDELKSGLGGGPVSYPKASFLFMLAQRKPVSRYAARSDSQQINARIQLSHDKHVAHYVLYICLWTGDNLELELPFLRSETLVRTNAWYHRRLGTPVAGCRSRKTFAECTHLQSLQVAVQLIGLSTFASGGQGQPPRLGGYHTTCGCAGVLYR
jgi:hypothetical protein